MSSLTMGLSCLCEIFFISVCSTYILLFCAISSLLGTAVDVAGKAASAAYSIAKDVYHTLQAQNAVMLLLHLVRIYQ